jgi:hypothetical protein
MILPKFILIQHAHGAAGKFISTALMCHPEVAHFDADVNRARSPSNLLAYAQQHFTPDLGQWLKLEPKPQQSWNLHFVSPSYDRGQQLTNEQFLQLAQEHGSPHFHEAVSQNQYICMSWHKKVVPEYFARSACVAIIIDAAAQKWFHRALWYKHFGMVDNLIHQKSHDPAYNSASVQRYYQQFNNEVLVNSPKAQFIRERIINSEQKKTFSDPKNFAAPNQLCINLSDVIRADRIQDTMSAIYQHVGLSSPYLPLISQLHQHWKSCHAFKYN